jgi:hypothetical protein
MAPFPALSYTTERGKHELLAHRLSSDTTKCYKFQFVKAKHNDGTSYYMCCGCVNAKKRRKSLSKTTIKSIKVSADKTEFLSDPEALQHFCDPFDFVATQVTQIYR